jgi:hypothetical protein
MLLELNDRYTILASGMPGRPSGDPPPGGGDSAEPEEEEEGDSAGTSAG